MDEMKTKVVETPRPRPVAFVDERGVVDLVVYVGAQRLRQAATAARIRRSQAIPDRVA